MDHEPALEPDRALALLVATISALVELDSAQSWIRSGDDVERRYIDRVLSSVDENRSAAARILGIDRRTLMRKLAARRP